MTYMYHCVWNNDIYQNGNKSQIRISISLRYRASITHLFCSLMHLLDTTTENPQSTSSSNPHF